ncbi:MAG TPA: hypothetical protein VHS76_13530 [Steroidobacteraceae bacterium]|nr:hypothetical protein [Steroidobacteraceae bacterium]
MQRRGEIVGWSTGALGFAALALSNSLAFAAPLQARSQPPNQPAQHLDLRAPSAASEGGNAAETSSGAFPSHRQNLALQQLVDLELVHLGLNPQGKPGLWLVQKTH